jgi:hypothetical protein
VSVAQPPVFVDDTGRRRILTRRAGKVVVLGFTAYLGLVALGFARNPRVGPVQLPTFGLPSLGLMVPPAPTVLGEQASRTAAEEPTTSGSGGEATTTAGGSTAAPQGDVPAGVAAPAATPIGRLAAPSRANASPATGLAPSSASSSSTLTSSTTTTSSSTTTTTSPTPGQGQGLGQDQGQGYDSASTKGPDGSGPPGQSRKTTTTTAG